MVPYTKSYHDYETSLLKKQCLILSCIRFILQSCSPAKALTNKEFRLRNSRAERGRTCDIFQLARVRILAERFCFIGRNFL